MNELLYNGYKNSLRNKTVQVFAENKIDLMMAKLLIAIMESKGIDVIYNEHNENESIRFLPDVSLYINPNECEQDNELPILFMKYGCIIRASGNTIFLIYNSEYQFSDWIGFQEYYSLVVGDRLKGASKLRDELRHRDQLKKTKGEDVSEKLMQGLDYLTFKATHLPFPLDCVAMFLEIPISLGAMILTIPLATIDILIENGIQVLEKDKFDSRYTSEAQRQILLMMFCDLFL